MASVNTSAFIYTGRDNLEAMRQAYRYNAFLQGLVEAAGEGHARWLDFGAGAGQFAVPLTRKGHNITALEPDTLLANALRDQGIVTHTDIHAITDESMDFAYSLNVLEHVENDQLALSMLASKMQPGATLLVYVPAFQSLFSEMDRLVGHHRRYNKKGLIQIIAQAGFDVRHCTYVDSLGYLASVVYKMLPRQTGAISPRSVAAYDRFIFPASRWLDRFCGAKFGKNLLAVARRSLP